MLRPGVKAAVDEAAWGIPEISLYMGHTFQLSSLDAGKPSDVLLSGLIKQATSEE